MAKKWSFHNALAGTRYVTSLFMLFWIVMPIDGYVTVVQFKNGTFGCSESPKKCTFVTQTRYLLGVSEWFPFWRYETSIL